MDPQLYTQCSSVIYVANRASAKHSGPGYGGSRAVGNTLFDVVRNNHGSVADKVALPHVVQ